MRVPTVELLWWEGCPSTQRALEKVRQALTDVGLADVEVRMREMATDADTQEAGFIGSPTIRIDGIDVVPPPDDEPVGFACRVYKQRDGRILPTPDPEDLREALLHAQEPASDA